MADFKLILKRYEAQSWKFHLCFHTYYQKNHNEWEHKLKLYIFKQLSTFKMYLQVLIDGFDPEKFRAANTLKKSNSMDADIIVYKRRLSEG